MAAKWFPWTLTPICPHFYKVKINSLTHFQKVVEYLISMYMYMEIEFLLPSVVFFSTFIIFGCSGFWICLFHVQSMYLLRIWFVSLIIYATKILIFSWAKVISMISSSFWKTFQFCCWCKKKSFSNFSCMFLNPDIFFPIWIIFVLIY